MNRMLMAASLAALLLVSGCSDKSEEAQPNPNDLEEHKIGAMPEEKKTADDYPYEEVPTEYVDSKENNAPSMSAVEAEFKTIYFDFDKYSIRTDMQSDMETDNTIANDQAKIYNIKLEGNCDEWGSDEYNYALGLKRAETVKDAMIGGGIDSNRISVMSYGKTNPVCTAHTRDCWAKNRRVNFKLLP